MKSKQITDRLFIADVDGARYSFDVHICDEIVTVGFDTTVPDNSTTGDEFVFFDGDHDYTTFKRATDYVVDSLQSGDIVMVHCAKGVSRSAGVASASLTVHRAINLQEAFELVRSKAPNTNPLTDIRESMERYTDDDLDDYRSEL